MPNDAMHARRDASRADPNVDAVPWVSEGILIGVVGAGAVALFFLLFDLAAGRPFWTPHLLGSAFFIGRPPDAAAAIEPALVVGYTLLHGGVFVAVGLAAAFELMTGTRLPGATAFRRALLLAALMLVAFELIFVAFAALMAPGVLALLGAGRVTVANLVAAIAMAGVLHARVARQGVARG
jgi:hypothetical protein